jgi:uncharacterized membrane protein YtjA (UPF0391 family)
MRFETGTTIMLYWTLIFLVLALLAGAMGFGGVASAAAGIAQVLFFVFMALLVWSLVTGMRRSAR